FNWRGHQRYAYFLGHLLRRFTPCTFKIAFGRDINNTGQPGYSFRKYLKAFTPDLNSGINADARDVAAWPRNIRYDSEPDWISGYGYNRNCVRECFEMVGQGSANRQDQIRLRIDDLLSERPVPLNLPPSRVPLDYQVFSLE